jgi:hypothetical protein
VREIIGNIAPPLDAVLILQADKTTSKKLPQYGWRKSGAALGRVTQSRFRHAF